MYFVIQIGFFLNIEVFQEQSDTEWKFARTKLWMSFFEGSSTLPSPFNILPSPKMVIKLYKSLKKNYLKDKTNSVIIKRFLTYFKNIEVQM